MVETASVIFTTKNRKEDLHRAISSALCQDFAVEIIVMDDGSEDGTTEMVRSAFPTVALYSFEKSGGSIIRRNEGAKRASGDILFLIDDDSEFSSPSVVRQVVANFDHARIGAVAIPFIDVRRDSSVRHKAPDHDCTWLANTYTGAACAVRRDIFLRLGGYRELLCHMLEERDFCIRMLNFGYVVRLGNSDVINHHMSPRRSNTWIRSIERRNNLIFSLCNVPFPELIPHLAGTIATGVRYAIKHRLVGTTLKGYLSLTPVLGQVTRERCPVRRSVYHLSRRLNRERACRLSDIERYLPPLETLHPIDKPHTTTAITNTCSEPTESPMQSLSEIDPGCGLDSGARGVSGITACCSDRNETQSSPRVIVVQKGSREHYLVARALHRRGMLAGMVVDWYAPKCKLAITLLQSFGGNKGRAAMAAFAADLPRSLVMTNRLSALYSKWVQGISPIVRMGYDRALKADTAFTQSASKCLGLPHEVFFGYSYMSLECMLSEKAKGVLVILDQIDGGPVEHGIVAEEMRRFPKLAGQPEPFPHEYFARLRREWEIADVIIANSEWSRQAMISEGVPRDKIELLPLAYEADLNKTPITNTASNEGAESKGNGLQEYSPTQLRVLWLGQVKVRKGIHYLIEAARILQERAVTIEVIGSIMIAPDVVASAPSNLTFHGAVSRSQVRDWYSQSHVFVLPTLSDGFAITQLEAFAHGLPVIATPNCGRVVEDGVTGLIIPPRDAVALAAAITKFIDNPGLIQTMGANAREAIKEYSIERYSERLREIILRHHRHPRH